MRFQQQLRACPQPWPLLRIGSRHWFVKMLRRVLAERGFGEPAWADADTRVGDYFDAELTDAVYAAQTFAGEAAVGPADGIVGPRTWAWLADEAPVAHTWRPVFAGADAHAVAQMLRTVALAYNRLLVELGVREHGGANRGEVVDAVNRHTLGQVGAPWCATVQDFCIDTAAKALSVPRPFDIGASSSQLYLRARATGRLRTLAQAQPGDLFILPGGATDWKHVGMLVEKMSGGRIRTCEGNTNDEGSAEGYEMVIRTRASAGLAFVDWSSG